MTEIAFTPTVSEQALLQELNHRISNEFQSALSLVSLTAARSRSQEVKDALSGVTVLLHHYAEVHRALQVPHDRDRVDAAEYLRKLCLSIRRSKLERAQAPPRTCGPSVGSAIGRVLALGVDCVRAYNQRSTACVSWQQW